MRISDWSSDVCSSDLVDDERAILRAGGGVVLCLRRRAPRAPGQVEGCVAEAQEGAVVKLVGAVAADLVRYHDAVVVNGDAAVVDAAAEDGGADAAAAGQRVGARPRREEAREGEGGGR